MTRRAVEAWLIGYDIRNRRRLARLHRYLKQHAVPIQYSVFVMVGTPGEFEDVLEGMRQRIRPDQDDVRCYYLGTRCSAWVLGRQGFPEGVLLEGMGMADVLTAGSREASTRWTPEKL